MAEPRILAPDHCRDCDGRLLGMEMMESDGRNECLGMYAHRVSMQSLCLMNNNVSIHVSIARRSMDRKKEVSRTTGRVWMIFFPVVSLKRPPFPTPYTCEPTLYSSIPSSQALARPVHPHPISQRLHLSLSPCSKWLAPLASLDLIPSYKGTRRQHNYPQADQTTLPHPVFEYVMGTCPS